MHLTHWPHNHKNVNGWFNNVLWATEKIIRLDKLLSFFFRYQNILQSYIQSHFHLQEDCTQEDG